MLQQQLKPPPSSASRSPSLKRRLLPPSHSLWGSHTTAILHIKSRCLKMHRGGLRPPLRSTLRATYLRTGRTFCAPACVCFHLAHGGINSQWLKLTSFISSDATLAPKAAAVWGAPGSSHSKSMCYLCNQRIWRAAESGCRAETIVCFSRRTAVGIQSLRGGWRCRRSREVTAAIFRNFILSGDWIENVFVMQKLDFLCKNRVYKQKKTFF